MSSREIIMEQDKGKEVDEKLGAESATAQPLAKHPKATELLSTTVRTAPYAYIHLERLLGHNAMVVEDLDALQVRSYCDAALKQFLGVTGSSIPVDVLKVDAAECWLRVPQPDLSAFAAAITAWPGVQQQRSDRLVLRIRACGDWLGSLAARKGQDELWGA